MLARVAARLFSIGLLAGGCLLSAGSPLAAKDHFLTIGGGYSPTGNQISLEKNVAMFQRIVAELYADAAPHDVLFADGDDPGRDLQFADPKYEIPRVSQLLATVTRQEKYLGYQYRSHQLEHVRDGSNRASLEAWFNQAATQLTAGDRLVIYVTAHGGRADDKKTPTNTKLMLWNGESIRMDEFARLLDKLPEDVSVAMVMVQCFSGGFADVIFQEGKQDKGATDRARCGFFATVNTRPAAGCTPDINEENYEEFSSYFWAALVGHRRTGQAIDKPDYDGDGRVSFAELHAYSILNSPTIDIPVKTSDALLRSLSKLEDKEVEGLITANERYDELFKLASPAERAVIEGLSTELNLQSPERAKEAEALANEIESQRKKLDGERGAKYKTYGDIAGDIAKRLKLQWPEMNNLWDPGWAAILRDESEAIVKAVEGHPRWQEMERLETEIENLDEEKLALEKKWCKCQRLVRALENVALAANLPLLADEAARDRYARLLAAEAGVLGE